MVAHTDLNERSLSLLKILVERYISEGLPVGSKTLAQESGVSLSPASIRNIMADLEARGMVVSPHTSAGRVPTVKGYRLFVDTLLAVKPLEHTLIDQLKLQLDQGVRPQELIDSASLLLSHTTGMAGVVMLPRLGSVLLQQIEFIPLSDNRILVILVVNEREVQNRIIHTERRYTQDELQRVANYLNGEFSGCELSSIRRGVHDSMQAVRDDMQQIMQVAMNMADTVLAEFAEDDLVIAGETNLMQYSEMADMDKLRQLFDAFNAKQDILHILDHSIHAQGMQIFIGEESGYSAFGECSVVTAPYRIEDQVVGVLGVIGPTRMAYDRVIPVVDVTAKILGSLLSSE
ncbi:Heat-inducible transcription repressor HrcA [hydrothermal vent metagenome]|uniref:Heat-inducible transcription repressor HrcA n=1 Tax=hydrothermal vent metagenome TaxID=652676 RepID=A0A3B1B4U1_9ZZZZ